MTEMIFFLLGPTAVGKSEVALRLAEEAGGAIVAMDSMQVYRGLDIGTGKPTAAERERVPHFGLDLVEPGETFDTARYMAAIEGPMHAFDPATPRFFVGGTGLYFRALTQGLSAAPPAPPELRAELQKLSHQELRNRLETADPGQLEVSGFDWSNPRRVQRALEVVLATGKPLRLWHEADATPAPFPLSQERRAVLLLRERDDLRERIARRVNAMFAAGWVDETHRLLHIHGPAVLRDCPAIGYAEIAAWIGEGSSRLAFPAMRQVIVDKTRQYAKRQLTWFRREPKVLPLTIPASESPAATAARVQALLS